MKTNIVFNLYLAFSSIVSILLFSVSANAQNNCGIFAGEPNQEQIVCWLSQAVGPTSDSIRPLGTKLKYYLHQGDVLNHIDSNFHGLFRNDGSYPTNTQLYISAAIGPEVGPGSNSPDLNDPCTDIQEQGTLVTFLDPIIFLEQEYTCNDNSIDVNFSVTGGYNNFMPSAYTVSGSTSSTINADENYSFSLPSLSGLYILLVEDENNCNIRIDETYQCGKVDLALIKRLDVAQSSVLNPGDNVTFTFEIINQGDVPVAQVALIDYIPNGLILNDSFWTPTSTQTAEVLLTPPSGSSQFIPGGTYSFNINFTVSSNVNTTSITNSAEISFIKYSANGDLIFNDEDSSFDKMTGNNGMPIDNEVNDPNDLDSHDIETITINLCDGTAGTMPTDTIFSCSDASATAIENGSSPAPNDVDGYVLHTSSTSTIGVIEDSNNSGSFSNPNIDCTILYISYVFGPDDGSGMPDLTNTCTIVLPGTPVVWSAPIIINSSETCRSDNPLYNVEYDITGGFAFCEGNVYTVTGDVNDFMASPGTEHVDATLFNSNTSYTINVTDNRGCEAEITKGPIVCDNPNSCNNNPGTMPSNILYGCAGELISITESNSQLDDNDIGIYILHDSSTNALGTIITSNSSGTFSEPQLQSPCSTLYISYVFGPDEDRDGIPDTNNECIKILEGTPVIWLPEITLSSTAQCDTDEDQYQITYTVNGGLASCNPNTTFSLSGTIMENNVVAGTDTHPDEIAGGTSYQITITDDTGCSATDRSNEPIDCNLSFCGNTPGEMQEADNPNACADSDITSIATGTDLLNGFIGRYYLHTNSGTTLGTEISSNTTGTFSDPRMPCTTLYISYVFGPNDGSGNILLDDNCTFVLAGTPVRWGEPLRLDTTEDCDEDAGTYTIDLSIGGGFAACDNTLTYNVTGDMNLNGESAGTYTSDPLNGGSSYTLTLEDGNNCVRTFTSEPISCEIVCGNTVGAPNAELIVCENKMADGGISDVTISSGSTLVYVLHDGENSLGDVSAVNDDGLFLNDGTYPVNTELYISAIIGNIANNDNIPDLSDRCTEAMFPGTPVVFLQEVTITTDIMCDENAGIATINYVVNGGHPAYDNSLSYNITGDADDTAPYDETKTLTNNTGSYTLTATDNVGCFNTISDTTGCTITEMCISQIGTQPSEPFILCDGEEVNAESIGYFTEPGATLVYVLHDGATTLGTITDKNSSGFFSNPGTYPTDAQLYVAAMIGVLNPAGIPDLNDECTINNFPGTPVTFLDPLAVEHSVECKQNGTATVSFTIKGGTGSYSITSSYTGSATEDEMISFDNAVGSSTYTLEITDSNGCTETINGTYDACSSDCANNAGSISQEGIYLCHNASFSFSVLESTDFVQDGYTLFYVLHDGQNMVGNIMDFNSEGMIFNDGSYLYNTQYYVSPVVTTLVNGNLNLNDPCLSVTLPGQPLWFLSPITVDDTIECDEDNGSYEVTFSIMGGAPAVTNLIDNYDYTVSNSGGGMASMGQIRTSQPQSNPDYTISVVDSRGCEASFFRNDINCNEGCLELSESGIPNIFSPNNDVSNRMWSIPNLQSCYPNNRVIISNRWGNIVWDKDNCEDNCWDGTAQNSEKPLPTGAYYYVIQLNGSSSADAEILSGSITLLR